MSANNKLTPINGMKNKVTKTNDNNESTSEVAIKVATILDRNTAQQQHSQSGGNGQNSQMEAGRKQTNRRVVQFGATNVQNTNQVIPWWKSSIIKLIGMYTLEMGIEREREGKGENDHSNILLIANHLLITKQKRFILGRDCLPKHSVCCCHDTKRFASSYIHRNIIKSRYETIGIKSSPINRKQKFTN